MTNDRSRLSVAASLALIMAAVGLAVGMLVAWPPDRSLQPAGSGDTTVPQRDVGVAATAATAGELYDIRGVHVVSGGLVMHPSDSACRLEYDSQDARIVVRNGTGRLLGASEFEPGEHKPTKGCVYRFTVRGVPREEVYRFYFVPSRPFASYSFAQMQAMDWGVELLSPRK